MGRAGWRHWLRRQGEDPLLRESAVLTVGTALGQIAPLLSLPLLGRLYSTTDFGVYALFVSAVNITSQFASLGYGMAIPTQGEEEAGGLLRLSALCSLGVGAALFLPLPLLTLVRWREPGGLLWALLVPPATALVGLYTALSNYHLRMGNTKAIAQAGVVRSLAMVLLQFILYPLVGSLGLGGSALAAGQLASYLAGSLWFLPGARAVLWRKTPPKELAHLARRHRDFPKFTLPGSLAGSLVYNLTSYLLAIFYSTQELGYYSMVGRVLFTPLTLLAGGVGQAFLHQAAKLRGSGEAGAVFRRATAMLLLVSLPLFGGLFLLAQPLVRLVFGSDWLPMADYLRLLIPLAVARFVVSPISTTPLVYGENRTSMVWQLGLLALSLLPAAGAWWFGISIRWYLGLLSLLLTAGYLALYIISLGLVEGGRRAHEHPTRKEA